MAAVTALVELNDGSQPEPDFQMSTSALQRLLPLMAAGRTTGDRLIAVIQSAKTATVPMAAFRSGATSR